MQRRPRSSRRRGLLRAVIAAIILIIVVLALLLLISSLTAQPAKAPTVPGTPTPPATPSASAVPTVRTGKTSVPKIKPKATSKGTHRDIALSGRPPGLAMRSDRPPSGTNAVRSANGRYIAYIAGSGDAYARSPLRIWSRDTGTSRTVTYADRLIRPAWSPDSGTVLFARVTPSPAYPGARWTLLEADAASGRVRALDNRNALNLAPLGWRSGRPLYLVATASDTSVYEIAHADAVFVSILMPQVITNPTLSPDGRFIAFAAPSDCFFCTYDDFEIPALHTTVGPSGGQNERDMAWSTSTNLLAVPLRTRVAVLRPPTLGTVESYPAPAGLPRVWRHPMTFTQTGRTLTLTDTVTHVTYSSTR